MVRSGVPDYGMYAALENMGNLVDYGELAARLQSLISFNREGNVVFWDDFECTPLKWVTDTGQPNSTVGLSPDEALSGGQSLKIVTGTNLGYEPGITRCFPHFATGKQGMEIAFSNEDKAYRFSVEVFIRRVTYWHRIRVRVCFDTNKIQLWDDTLTWQDVATDVIFDDNSFLFHHLKVVVDTANNCYVRIMIDRNEYNVEKYNMCKVVEATGEMFEIKYFITNYISVACKIYLDNFILTQNEP